MKHKKYYTKKEKIEHYKKNIKDFDIDLNKRIFAA